MRHFVLRTNKEVMATMVSTDYKLLSRRHLFLLASALLTVIVYFVMGVAIILLYNFYLRDKSPCEATSDKRTISDLRSGLSCYQTDHIDSERIRLFTDVMADEILPTDGTNIFFHETTCLNGTAQLNMRQACAVESAARANPNTKVFLLYASPVGFEHGQPRPAVFEALATYPNVHWRNLNLWTYTRGTPAADWMRSGDLFRSRYLSVHMSDFLRLVSLFKWGGTNMDLDIVVRKSLEQLPPTYTAEEYRGTIENDMINFDQSGMGEQLTSNELVTIGEGSAYEIVAREFCPKVFATVRGKYF